MALYKDIHSEIRDQGVEIPEPDGDSLRLYATAWNLVTVPTLTSTKTFKSLNLDDFSVEDLDNYILELKNEFDMRFVCY